MQRRRQERARRIQQELDRIVDLLKKRGDVRRILLFGSFAAGRSGSHSDIDLVVVMETDHRFRDRIEELYVYVLPEVDLDLLVYTPQEWQELQRQRGFLQRIGKAAKVIYEDAA